ncbi:hypothetical protein K0M31_020327 [Melipona bicolor]|uniref:Uncharacterized protein n=1 Tax=Melipona bicolor TaxID=60889 RepID=A0AA40G1Y1_9HYME|nr:hypothetical protein K0M31_020327 [Melipona bicolor]
MSLHERSPGLASLRQIRKPGGGTRCAQNVSGGILRFDLERSNPVQQVSVQLLALIGRARRDVTKRIADEMETKAVGFLSCDSWRNSPTRRPVACTFLTRTAREYPTWRAFGANPGVKLLFTVRRLGVSIGKSAPVNLSTNKRPVHFIEERSEGSSMADSLASVMDILE